MLDRTDRIHKKICSIVSMGKESVQETCIKQIYSSWILKEGHTGIDVGSCIGSHTIPMARCVGPQGMIYSFEANPKLALELSKKTLLNKNIKVLNFACTDKPTGPLSFYIVPEQYGQSTLVKGYGKNFHTSHAITIESTSLDFLFSNGQLIKKLSFIKIDAEGAELLILNGMKGSLNSVSPFICAEISLFQYFNKKDGFSEFLKSSGYRCLLLSGLDITDLNQPSELLQDYKFYTLVFARYGHWLYEFAINPLKMSRIVEATLDRYIK